jgi:malate dehydrogenase (oxaloacetate-decarboxylating)(NADP+)
MKRESVILFYWEVKEIILIKEELGFDADLEIIDPKIKEEDFRRNKFIIPTGNLVEKGISLYDAQKLMQERNYFAAMMVNEGDADGLVTGHTKVILL